MARWTRRLFPATTVRHGSLDASAFPGDVILLAGEWEVLEDSQNPAAAHGYAHLPGKWAKPYGYAAYRLKITGLDPTRSWALETSYLDTSYRISVDGKPVLSAGTRDAVITLEVANFTHMRGGPYRGILLGSEEYLNRYESWSLITELVTIGIMLFLGGLACMSALLSRRSSPLWFGLMLFSGALGLFLLCPDFPVYQFFPNLGFDAYLRISYALIYLVPLWFFLAARSIFGGYTFVQTGCISLLSAILCLAAILLPARVFTSTNIVYEINTLVLFALAIVIFVRAVTKSYPYAKTLFLGFLIFVDISMSVMLFANNRIYRGNFSALAFLYPLFNLSPDSSFYLDVASYLIAIIGLNAFCVLFFFDAPKASQPSPKIAESSYKDRIAVRCETLGFSPREIEVTLLALEGKRNKEIADLLFVSENTVKTHLSRIFVKAGIKARSELFATFAGE
jgi:DNA-binding CsgD family transcriptional regulator